MLPSWSLRTIVLLIYCFINGLFIYKYGLRLTDWKIITGLFLLYNTAVILITQYILPLFRSLKTTTLYIAFTAITILLIILQYSINPTTIQVDRWSAIHHFLDNLTTGIYPYSAQTHLGGYGSPFPVWQLLHLPFYFLHNVGLSFTVGLLLFLHSLSLHISTSRSFCALLLLIISPAFLYEIIVRSDLMVNILVSSSILLYCIHHKLTITQHYIPLAIIIGLLMSTRLSAIIPFCIYYFQQFWHTPLKQQIPFITIIITTFGITFLPLLLWDSNMLLHFQYNPFILQTRQGHLTDFLLYIPIGIILAYWHKQQLYSYFVATTTILIILVTTTFLHQMYIQHTWLQLFQSTFDITYYGMALPTTCAALVTQQKSSPLHNNPVHNT